jgi:hypothetical protein
VSLGNTAGISATQTANAQFGGSVSYAVRVVTAKTYTIANDDYTVLCNNSAGGAAITITPPPAAPSNTGRVYVVKRINVAGSNCLLGSGVDGAAGTHTLSPPGTTTAGTASGYMIQSDGTTWWIIGFAP